MTAKPTTIEDLRRAAVEKEQLRKVRRMEARLEDMDTCILDQASLDSLGVVVGHPLDVDNIMGLWGSGMRFFQPWVPNELVAQAAAGWSLKWKDKLVPGKYGLSEWQYGHIKAQWFHGAVQDLYEMDSELWEPWQVDPCTIRENTGLDLPLHEFEIYNPSTDEYLDREYHPEAAYFPVDKTKPHIACFAIDSNHAPGDQVLRSDVHYAIELTKFRLEKGQHTNHHTKPTLIYTLERDQFARITQAHLDSKTHKLVLRQSRQLDLRGAKPTPDAYLLVCWMASRPGGATEYVDEAEPREEEEVGDGAGSAPPRLVLGCA